MLKHKRKILIGVLAGVAIYVIANVVYSYSRLMKYKDWIHNATRIQIKARFVNDKATAIHMATLSRREDIQDFATNFDLKLWSSALEFPGVNSYAIEIETNAEVKSIDVNRFGNGVLRVIENKYMQALTPKFAFYFRETAESQGVLSEEAFETLINRWRAE